MKTEITARRGSGRPSMSEEEALSKGRITINFGKSDALMIKRLASARRQSVSAFVVSIFLPVAAKLDRAA